MGGCGISLALAYPGGKAEAARRPSIGAAGHEATGPVWLPGTLCNLRISLLWPVGESMWAGYQHHQPGGVWVPSLPHPT